MANQNGVPVKFPTTPEEVTAYLAARDPSRGSPVRLAVALAQAETRIERAERYEAQLRSLSDSALRCLALAEDNRGRDDEWRLTAIYDEIQRRRRTPKRRF